jgi:hypothetical protein
MGVSSSRAIVHPARVYRSLFRQGAGPVATIYTFGDSILDCGRYNARGVTPGGLPAALGL